MARRLAPHVALLALLAFAFIGRAVISSDGSEIVSETLGIFVSGRVEAAALPPPGTMGAFDPMRRPSPYHSRYGAVPSLLAVPFTAAAWPFRDWIGARGLDAAIALTWAAGVAFAAIAFVRLVRTLRPEASFGWGPALVAGTFLWPYAADSFVEPFAGGFLALGAASLLSPGTPSGARSAVRAGGALALAFLVKPVLWLTAPVFLLAALVSGRREQRTARYLFPFILVFVGALASQAVLNLARQGSVLDFGYGKGALAFRTPLAEGLLGLTVLPGRSLFLYAPLVLLALFSARRLTGSQQLILIGIPALVLLVMARWWAWHGASAWGPRLLLPVLPLLAAPAVLQPVRRAIPVVAAGALLNVGGVLVAPGAFIGYAERLHAPEGSTWPTTGSERVSLVPALSPLWGHPWVLLRGAGVRGLPAPWLRAGAAEGEPAPAPADCLSPLLLRSALGLPPVSPLVPRLLTNTGWAYAVRGRPDAARRFVAAALRLDPGDPDARRLREALGP